MVPVPFAALALASSLAASPAPPVVVFCSPGSPGTTAEAQPTMDAFAQAVRPRAGLGDLGAVYHESEQDGVARLRRSDAVAAVVSLPFFLKYESELELRARLQVIPKGREATERWALVAKRGRVASPAALAGFSIVSVAGFAPAFVAGPALGGYGPLPPTARVTPSAAVLSALRRAASGDDVVVLLDGAQAAALATLPFAAELEVLARSDPLPVAIVALVDAHLAPPAARKLEAALRLLSARGAGAAALEGVQVDGFVTVDQRTLGLARRAYRRVVGQ